MGKIATCWAKIGSRVWKGGRNDGLDGFLRFNNILKKNSKTGFRDRCDRSLFSIPLGDTLENFGALGDTSLPYLPLRAHCGMQVIKHRTHTVHTNT